MSEPALDLHLIAIGGTGMAPLACLLKELGHRVRGSDGPLYPPMSTLLAEAGIESQLGFEPEHLKPPPDLVVVGNAVPRHNPQAQAMESLGLPRVSMPEAIGRFLLSGRHPLVVAGTHGKTTTTSLCSWLYEQVGADPSYLIGGVPLGMERSFRLGAGERFVIEGDEYNASYFDRGPKFLHYRPETVILTSAEHDHADLYPAHSDLLAAYARLVELLPPKGLLIACGDDDDVRRLAEKARCRVLFYGLREDNELRPLGPVVSASQGSRWRIVDREAGEVELQLALPGEHNLCNAMAAWAAARSDGLPVSQLRAAMASFRGVQRRLQELGTADGATVVDDFAHHPTAVAASLRGLAERYPGQRLVALFEPRSLSAGRKAFAEAYLEAFSQCQVLYLAPIFHAGRLSDDERLDLADLCAGLSARGVEAQVCSSIEEVLRRSLQERQQGDILVTMSSGSFEGLPHRLLEALETQSERASHV